MKYILFLLIPIIAFAQVGNQKIRYQDLDRTLERDVRRFSGDPTLTGLDSVGVYKIIKGQPTTESGFDSLGLYQWLDQRITQLENALSAYSDQTIQEDYTFQKPVQIGNYGIPIDSTAMNATYDTLWIYTKYGRSGYPLGGTSYFVSYSGGNDNYSGLEPDSAWKTLVRIRDYMDGDSTYDSNLIIDGTFEDSLSTLFVATNCSLYTSLDNPTGGGDSSLCIVDTSDALSYVKYSFPTDSGSTYEVDFWCRNNGGATNAKPYVYTKDDDLLKEGSSFHPLTSWTKYSSNYSILSFTATSDTCYFQIRVASNGDSVLVDNITAREYTVAGTFDAGDRILLKRGDTWTSDSLYLYNATVGALFSGTSGNPITIATYGSGDRPVIDGGNSINNLFYLFYVQYVNVFDLEIKNAYSSGFTISAYDPSGDPQSTTILGGTYKNLYLHRTGIAESDTNASARNASIYGSYWNMVDCVLDSAANDNMAMGGGHNTVDGCTFSNSDISGTTGDGLQTSVNAYSSTIKNCTFTKGNSADVNKGGIVISDSSTTGNFIIEYNTFTGGNWAVSSTGKGTITRYNVIKNTSNTTFGQAIKMGGRNQEAYYNTIYNVKRGFDVGPNYWDINNGTSRLSADSMKIYNNTIVNATDRDIRLWSEAGSLSVYINNNICYNNTGSPAKVVINDTSLVTILSIDNNLYYPATSFNFNGTAITTFSAWQDSTGSDANSVTSDPLFYNVTGENFRLQTGSPAINAGTDVGLTQDIERGEIVSTPDIGAREKK